jgi:GxxExxY protein
MHPLFAKADSLSGEVIAAATEVHRIMGPGLLVSIYERCLIRELELRGIPVLNQEEVVIDYKGTVFKEILRFDVLVDGCLLVELKAINQVLPIHQAYEAPHTERMNRHRDDAGRSYATAPSITVATMRDASNPAGSVSNKSRSIKVRSARYPGLSTPRRFSAKAA